MEGWFHHPGLIGAAGNIATAAGNLAVAVVDHAADGFRKASTGEVARRESICKACPDSSNNGQSCQVCGCGTMPGMVALGLDLPRKIRWASSSCPKSPPLWTAEK